MEIDDNPHTIAEYGIKGARNMPSPLLNEELLASMLEVIKGADTVELKLTVPDTQMRATAVNLGLDPIEAEIRQIVFFDTPDLALNASGLVVRARRIQKGAGDTVIKLRPVDPRELPREHSRIGVEVDAMPGGFVCSASMKGTSSAKDIAKTIAGDASIKSLFSKGQRSFYKEHAPEGLKLKDLVALGPILTLRLKSLPQGFGRKLVTELWLYPDGSQILELSTKCAPGEAIQVAAEARVFLTARGIDMTGVQQTKTKTALEYFSSLMATTSGTRLASNPKESE